MMTRDSARDFLRTYDDSQKNGSFFEPFFCKSPKVSARDSSSQLLNPIIKQPIFPDGRTDGAFLVI